jgi:hypothetical protein
LLARLREDFRDGTFPPFSRVSFIAMAIACFRLFTFRPDPLLSVPFFLRRIADSTFLEADLPYFAMFTSRVGANTPDSTDSPVTINAETAEFAEFSWCW